jgi:hypothetical protein
VEKGMFLWKMKKWKLVNRKWNIKNEKRNMKNKKKTTRKMGK